MDAQTSAKSKSKVTYKYQSVRRIQYVFWISIFTLLVCQNCRRSVSVQLLLRACLHHVWSAHHGFFFHFLLSAVNDSHEKYPFCNVVFIY